MNTIRWLRTFAVLALAAAVAAPSRIAAQGTTTAAITGTVTDSTTKEPIEAAQVQVINKATGAALTTQTRPSGLYFVSGLEVGVPYSITVRRIGFRPKTDGVARLSLSQRAVVNFELVPQAATLAAITVEAGDQLSPVINPNRKGTGSLVDDSILKRAPTLNRNFTDFMSTVPQVASQPGGSSSAGGVNNRFNNIQIDGANSNDLFGLGSTGQPGGQSKGKSISLDAVKEYQVLLSPYDLNFSGFNGALVNAVTKSGTNEWQGDAFYYFRNQNFAQNVPFIQNSGLYVEQYGASVSGPIIKDRLHFFANVELQLRAQPSSGPYIGQSPTAASPLTVDSATTQRFINDLTALGIPAGTGGATNNANPLTNAFGRLDLALPEINSTLTIRDNYASGSDDNFSRTSTFPLTSQLFNINDKNNSFVAQLNTNMQNGSNNEFIAAYQAIKDVRLPAAGVYPTIIVTVPGLQSATINELGGAEQFSQGNTLDQKMLQLKDNYSFFVGDKNRVTAGISAEFWKFSNLFTESSYGVWTFNSLDSLEAGNANRYRISLPLTNPPAVVAAPEGVTYGAYIQNNWTPNPDFNMLFGLRIDVPVISNNPPYTASFDTIFGSLFQSMGRQANTSQVPSGNIQWEPRVGFNWDMDGEKRNQLRGGAGVFVGRPAMVWVANSWQNSGSGLGFLQCGRATDPGPITPVFSADAANQPQTCANGAGLASGVVGPVDIMDKNLKMPEVFRANLAYDTRLPNNFFLTFEALYTQGLNNFFYINRNINYDSAYIGRNGRYMYGTLAASGVPTTFVYDASHRYSEVIDVVNQSKDYSYDLTVELHKRVFSSLDTRIAYTYSHSYDVQSLNSSRAISNWNFGREEGGNLLAQNATTSIFDQPNKLLISGTYTFPWKTWTTDFSLIYQGFTGSPYDYIYGGAGSRGDINGDGDTNDLIYIPLNVFDPNEIRFAPIPASGSHAAVPVNTQQLALYNLIQNTPCLKRHQGEIMPRNSCQNPWVNTLDATLIQSLPRIGGHTVTLRVDIFNLPNMLNGQWGLIRQAGGSTFNNVTFLNVTGTTAPVNHANPQSGIPIVQFQPTFVQYPTINTVGSYYQLQFSARFDW
jgi:hypothetical protein